MRLIIEEKSTEKSIGMIDLFDFNPQHKRAGIGIVIHPDFQQKGFASEALSLLIQYAFTHLQLHQLYANILTDNEKSLQLFENQLVVNKIRNQIMKIDHSWLASARKYQQLYKKLKK